MTMRQAVGVSVASYPEHDIVANNRRATDEERRQAEGLYLPQIDARAGRPGMSISDNIETRDNLPGYRENQWRYEAGITPDPDAVRRLLRQVRKTSVRSSAFSPSRTACAKRLNCRLSPPSSPISK